MEKRQILSRVWFRFCRNSQFFCSVIWALTPIFFNSSLLSFVVGTRFSDLLFCESSIIAWNLNDIQIMASLFSCWLHGTVLSLNLNNTFAGCFACWIDFTCNQFSHPFSVHTSRSFNTFVSHSSFSFIFCTLQSWTTKLSSVSRTD